MIRLSVTSKLDGIPSWSLNALETCPGSRNDSGGLVDACAGCYATGGFYRMSVVRATRTENQQDWKRDGWVDDMIAALADEPYFRWFDSGDAYDLRLLRKIVKVVEGTPNTKHWMPTRMHKFAKFRGVLEQLAQLPNIVVRYSSDSVTGDVLDTAHSSTIIPTAGDLRDGMTMCGAYERDGTCSGCRACWSKDVPVVAYVAHGRGMKKVIRLKQLDTVQ